MLFKLAFRSLEVSFNVVLCHKEFGKWASLKKPIVTFGGWTEHSGW